MHTWSPGVGEATRSIAKARLFFESTFGMSSWGVLTTTLNIIDSRTRGFSGLAGPSQRLVTPARSREVGVAFDYRHTWVIPEAWERSSRYWWLSIAESMPEVWLFLLDVLSNGIELDARPCTRYLASPHWALSLGNSWFPWGRAMLQSSDYACELPPSFIGVMSTTFSTEVGWRRSFTEIVSHPTQQPDCVLSHGSSLASRLSLHLKESPPSLHLSCGIHYGTLLGIHCTARHYGTWSFTVRNLSPVSSRCSRFPDVVRHQRACPVTCSPRLVRG